MYSLIALILYVLISATYRAFTTPNNRIVTINEHEYIESGYRITTLIHSESCKNPVHKKR